MCICKIRAWKLKALKGREKCILLKENFIIQYKLCFFAEAAGLWLALTQSATGKMPDSESNLVSSHVDVINGTSVLSERKISDEKGSVEKRAVTQIGKDGYPDSIYINAAKIFQGLRTEKSSGKILLRYGDTSESPTVAFKDEQSRRVSYELAFKTLKCKYKTHPRIAHRNDAAEKAWKNKCSVSACLTAEI